MSAPRRAKPATFIDSELGRRQLGFAAAILDPNRPVPRGLVGPDGELSPKRFAVYRNNVVAGLVDTLKAAYPATLRIVGEEFFAAMARFFVAAALPRSPIMLDYGAGFPDFIDAFEPAAGVPYLGDIARLERAWGEAYHAAEARPTDPVSLAAIAPDRLAHLGVELHPSLRVVRSAFPIVTIWQMNIAGGVPRPVDIHAGAEDALIVRSTTDVEVRTLPTGVAAFIAAIAADYPLGDATSLALADAADFDLAGALHGLLVAGAVVGYRLPRFS